MCLECGCGRPGPTKIDGKPVDGHVHDHDPRARPSARTRNTLTNTNTTTATSIRTARSRVHQSIFAANDRQRRTNRGTFLALNLSS